jgi:hypothetical protein
VCRIARFRDYGNLASRVRIHKGERFGSTALGSEINGPFSDIR